MEILVVEDEPGIADFLARGLGAEGYEVTVAADGVGRGAVEETVPVEEATGEASA